METALVSESRYFAGLNREQLQQLYEPIVLEYALIQSCRLGRSQPEGHSPIAPDTLQQDLEAVRHFSNKLAQVCDNKPRGKTVTAVAIIKGSCGPVYVIATNRRGPRESRATEMFLKQLFHLVGENPEHLQISSLQKKALRVILSFNMLRVEAYLRSLRRSLSVCLDNCPIQGVESGEMGTIYQKSAGI